MHTPEFPVLLSPMSGPAAAELARDLAAAGRQLPGVNAAQEAADAFAAAWRDRTGDAVTCTAGCACSGSASSSGQHQDPREQPGWPPNGTGICWPGGSTRSPARSATRPGTTTGAVVDERLGYGGITLWEAGGVPVSIAGRTRAVAGMVRVAPVYTPPELRGRGYAGAATAAVSQAALDAGVREVVLYTDLANPTSNALYQRLGYRPVEDRVIFSFEPARRGLGFTR